MRNRKNWAAVVLGVSGALASLVAAQEAIPGERLAPSEVAEPIVESWDDALARQASMDETLRTNMKGRNGAQGTWIVPTLGGTHHPKSGLHNVINKWGDTRMGIGFPSPVDIHGAFFAGQAAPTLWAPAIRAIGYRDGAETARTRWFTNIADRPAWFAINLTGVDRVVIEAKPALHGTGWYAMDDLTFTVLPTDADAELQRRVLDFEDLRYKTTLSGSGYAGLTWESGTGEFETPTAIQPPHVPTDFVDPAPPAEDDGGPAAAAGGTATLPEIDQSFIGDDLFNSIPPDTMGAIGPSHFVVMVNSVISVYNRTSGNLISSMTLNAFQPGSSGDPRILFDQETQRWIAINTDFNSRIFLAVSRTDSPTGLWFKTNFTASTGSDSNKFPDFPTLGVDANGVYIAASMFGTSTTMTIWAIDKVPLVDPAPTMGTITAFRSLPWEGAIQPAHTYGNPAGEFLLSRSSGTSIRVRRVNPPLTSPTLTQPGFITIPNHGSIFAVPLAPAMGSATNIDAGDARLQMAIYRDGSFWTAHTIGLSGRGACRWYEMDAGALSLIQSGTVSDASLHYYYPSINVNSVGGVVMGFSGSDAGTFVNAYYTGRVQSDTPGQMASPVILKPGGAPYNLLDGQGRNRWGDYSYTTVDPLDDRTIWTIQEYARSTNNWGTWVAAFKVSDCNDNGISDPCDIDCGSPGGSCDLPGCGGSLDCNANEVPDDCEEDCNNNTVPDDCDIASAFSPDCNTDGVPDECELAGGTAFDCQPNGVLDECDIADLTSVDCVGPPTDCFTPHGAPGCDNPTIEACVCGIDSACCAATWDSICVTFAEGCSTCPPGLAGNGVPDECEIPCTVPQDCSDGDACTDEICDVDGFCTFLGINYDPQVDCCDPSNGDLTAIEDGDPCTTGSCDPETGVVTQVPGPDGPAPGCGVGDPCNNGACQSGVCVLTPKIYGDVNNDGGVDVFDILCVLDGFAQVFTTCSFDEVNINPCMMPDGVVDVFDILAVLDAFAGVESCCP